MYTQLSENLTQIRNQLIQSQGDVARITAERDDLVQRTTAEMNDLKNALAEAKQRTYVVKPGDCPRSVNPSQNTHNQQRNSPVALFWFPNCYPDGFIRGISLKRRLTSRLLTGSLLCIVS